MQCEEALSPGFRNVFAAEAAALHAEDLDLDGMASARGLGFQGGGKIGKIAWNTAALIHNDCSLVLRRVEGKLCVNAFGEGEVGLANRPEELRGARVQPARVGREVGG